jgi:MoaA/NifB/PqqE/SkfB family radical SAM enzyme
LQDVYLSPSPKDIVVGIRSDIRADLSSFLLDGILRSSRRRMALVLWLLAHAGFRSRRHEYDRLRELLRSNHPFLDFLKRLNGLVSRRCRKRLISNLVVRGLFLNGQKRAVFKAREGFYPPRCVSIAPTSRCNLRCRHCSSNGQAGEDLPPDVMLRVMKEAHDEMGVHFFILTGGEPFLYAGLFETIERFPDSYFQIFTNGTMLDGENAKRLARAGNAIVMLSIEGTESETDLRRRRGTFRAVEESMDLLAGAGVPFGYGVMATSGNCDYITSEEFVEWALGRGCLVGYYFHYMPVGSDSDPSLMPSPEQRDRCRKNVYRLRNSKPILLIDVINDGPLTGGCTSSGRHYVHILSGGDVTPCVYSNFSTSNVKDVSLTEALKSPFLSTLRRAIPFEGNALRCCFLLDRPGFYFRVLERFDPVSRIAGEKERLRELEPELRIYAARMKELYDEAWRRGEWESLIGSVDWVIGR